MYITTDFIRLTWMSFVIISEISCLRNHRKLLTFGYTSSMSCPWSGVPLALTKYYSYSQTTVSRVLSGIILQSKILKTLILHHKHTSELHKPTPSDENCNHPKKLSDIVLQSIPCRPPC